MSIAREIVGFAMKAGSSDIHLEEGSPIAVRVNSDIKISPQNLGREEMDSLLVELWIRKIRRIRRDWGFRYYWSRGTLRLRINAYVANQKMLNFETPAK